MTKIPSWTFCLIFFPQIFAFIPWLKMKKNVFCRGQHFPWISLYFPDSQELLEGYSWALGILELSPLIFLPPSLAEAPEQQFPQIPFLLPPSTKSGVYYSHKKIFSVGFSQILKSWSAAAAKWAFPLKIGDPFLTQKSRVNRIFYGIFWWVRRETWPDICDSGKGEPAGKGTLGKLWVQGF